MDVRGQENDSSSQRDNFSNYCSVNLKMKLSIENIIILKNDLSTELFNYYSSSQFLAIDCEMMGLNPVRDRLCLIQMCDQKEKVTLVKLEPDILSKEVNQRSPNLKKLLENPEIKKIFHFGRTDMAFLYWWLGIEIKNVFCTKSASKLTRTYTDKHSLKDLLKDTLSVDMDKTSQLTDWGAPELSKDQIKYAANDVLHLIPLHFRLIDFLKRENRLEIAEEANKFLPTLAKLDLLGYIDFFAH